MACNGISTPVIPDSASPSGKSAKRWNASSRGARDDALAASGAACLAMPGHEAIRSNHIGTHEKLFAVRDMHEYSP